MRDEFLIVGLSYFYTDKFIILYLFTSKFKHQSHVLDLNIRIQYTLFKMRKTKNKAAKQK